jgi:zinc protease
MEEPVRSRRRGQPPLPSSARDRSNLGPWTQWLALLSILFAVCCGSPAPPKPPETPIASFRIRDLRLPSGLRLIAEQDNAAPVVGVVNVVGIGSTSDPAGKEGLAHLVEHLTFAAKRGGRTMTSLLQQAGAGISNAETDHDCTSYYEFGPRDAALDLLVLEGIRMSDPLAGVDEAIFNAEREVVRAEIRQRGETAVGGAVWQAISKATYPAKHAYSRPVGGTHESLDRLTLADAQAFVKTHYRPANMTTVITGDLPIERLDGLVLEAFPPSLLDPVADRRLALRHVADPSREAPDPPPSQRLVKIEGLVTTPVLNLAWSLPPTYGPTSHLAQLAVGGLSTAIDHAKQKDKDILDGKVTVIPGMQAGTVVASIALREGSHPENSANLILSDLLDNDIDIAIGLEMTARRRIARAATLMLFESDLFERRGVERARFAHFTGDSGYVGNRLNAISRISFGEVGTFFLQHLSRERARMVLVRPIPMDRSAPPSRIGVARPEDTDRDVKYDLQSLRKLAVAPSFGRLFHVRTLRNGMVVEAARHGKAPIVTIGLTIRSGLTEERESGAASTALHFGKPESYSEGDWSDYGALLDRASSPDATTFRVRVTSQHVTRVLPHLAHYVKTLKVRDSDVEEFDRDWMSFLRRKKQDPEVVGERTFREAVFGSHVFGHPSEIPSVGKLNPAAANRWIANHLTPARATLAIAGDIDPEEVLRMVDDAFGGWPGPVGDADPEPLGQVGGAAQVITHRPGATQAVIHLACRLPRLDASQLVAAKIVAIAFSERVESPHEGAEINTYGLSASIQTFRGGTAMMHVGGAVNNAGLATSLRTLRTGLAKITELRAQDIDRGRWVFASRYNLGLVSSDQWVARALDAARNGWSIQSIDTMPDAVATVDAKNVLSALRSCAADGVLSIVGDETSIRTAIKEVWPLPPPTRRVSVSRP